MAKSESATHSVVEGDPDVRKQCQHFGHLHSSLMVWAVGLSEDNVTAQLPIAKVMGDDVHCCYTNYCPPETIKLLLIDQLIEHVTLKLIPYLSHWGIFI